MSQFSSKQWSQSDIDSFLMTPKDGNPSTWYWHTNAKGQEQHQPDLIDIVNGIPKSKHWLEHHGFSVLRGEDEVGFFYVRLSDVTITQGMGNSQGGPILEIVNFDVTDSSSSEEKREIRKLLCEELAKIIQKHGNPAIIPACHKSLDHLLGLDD